MLSLCPSLETTNASEQSSVVLSAATGSPVSTGRTDCFVLAPDCVKYLLDKVCASTAAKCVAKHYSTEKCIRGFLRGDLQFVEMSLKKNRSGDRKYACIPSRCGFRVV